MRILNVITRLNIGGVSPPVIGLATGLKARGHASAIVVGTQEPGEGSMEADAEQAGVEVIRVPALRRNPHLMRDLVVARDLLREFRRFKPDVVATHMSKAGALGRLAARAVGVPVIVHTYHGKGFHVFDERWKQFAALTLERVLSRAASGAIVVSDKQREEFVRLGVDRPERIERIRYGLDLAPFLAAQRGDAKLRLQLGLPSDATLVGVVGRLVGIKGQHVFIRAAAALASRYPHVHFVLAGDGERRSAYEALAHELGVERRMAFLGWRRDVPGVLGDLDIVVLPTVNDFEGTPLAVIEALAACRPVVASDVGGVGEVIKDGITGCLIPPRDVNALAAAIARMLEDRKSADRMAAAGRQLTIEHYQRERMVSETERYFLRLLSERGYGNGT